MVGVDLSSKSIGVARAKASIVGVPDVSFMVSDAEALSEVPESSVDGVVAFSTLRFVPDLKRAHIHDHHYSTREIVPLMRGAGFVDVAVRRILFTTYVLPTRLLPLFRDIIRSG